MEHDKTYDEASKVSADGGDVIVDGPDGVAVTLTPDAAIETSDRLLDSGLIAQGQRVAKRGRGTPPPPER
jgi:hypothetical protein